MRQYVKIFLATIFSILLIGAFGQEYDDLYFTKEDRKKKKKKVEMSYPSYETQAEGQQLYVPPVEEVEATSFLGRQFQEANPTVDVSQESLDYYEPEKKQEDYISQNSQSAYVNGTDRNPNYSDPQVTSYENYDNPNNQPVIVNNYYNDNWNTWNRWNNPGWRFGFGLNSWGGSFWSVSYGNAWGNPWYDPFWDPWYYNMWGPAWGWNAGWGWNSWAWNGWGWGGGFYGSAWCPPYYRRPVYIVDNGSRRGRDVVRGARPSRGSVSSRESRSSSGRGSAIASDDRRSYSRQQADYLNRSRSSRYNPGVSRGSSSVNSRTTNSRSSLFNNSDRSNTNSNYTRPSGRTNTRSYSPPASSSRSRSSSVRSSSPSRSSGSVSRSRGSSSSRSSGSRSSSGRSSSGRRGGN